VFKNFGNEDSDTAFNYLQKQHPELNFRKADSGDIEVSGGSGGDQWKKLDPTNKWYAPELEDITDGIYGFGQGIAETGASALGGIGGAIAGAFTGPAAPIATPALALGGAGAAGAATGAAGDSLRQKIGQTLGIPQEFSEDSVRSNAKWGALSPLLFGTGAAGKHVAKAGAKYAAKEGLTEAGEQLLKAQSGVFGKTLRGAKGALGTRTGQLMSGIDRKTLQYANDNLDKIQAAEKSATGGAEIYGELREKIEGALEEKLSKAGEKIGKAGADSGIQANVVDVEAPMRELLLKYEEKALKAIEKHGDAGEGKKDFLKFEQLQKALNPYMENEGVLTGKSVAGYLDNLNEITGIAKDRNSDLLKGVKKDLQNVSRRSAKILDDQASSGAAGKKYKEFKSEYAQLKDIEKNITNKWFKDDNSTELTLNNLLSRKRKSRKLDISKAMEKLEVDVDDPAKESLINTLFVDPSTDALSSMGATSTSRSVPLGGVGRTAGYLLGARNGQSHGSGLLGGALGEFVGSKLGSPATMRSVMEANAAAGRAKNAIHNLGPVAPPQAAINIWQELYPNEQ